MTERLPFHFSLSCIGEGNGNPLQYSCLENPRDCGAWWVAVYGVAQSRTRLKQLSSSSSFSASFNPWALSTKKQQWISGVSLDQWQLRANGWMLFPFAPQYVFLGKILLAFALLHFVLQSQTCLLPQVSLDFLLLHSSPLWWKGHHFGGVSSRRS